MYHDFTYEATLAASLRGNWKLDNVLRADQELDFSRNFLPDSLAGTGSLTGLSDDERRTLNQICAYQYLFLFGVFEEFIVPFVAVHADEPSDDHEFKSKALLNFAEEEKKHIALFERYRAAFERGFPVPLRLIKSAEVIPQIMKLVHPLSGALFVLLFEWMTQSHYVDSIRDDTDIDPLFKSLLKHHWIEEAQHAKLDTLIVDSIAAKTPPEEMERVRGDFIELFIFMNNGIKIQTGYNVNAFERATNKRVTNRELLIAHLHRAGLWAFVGCGMVHPRVRATIRSISPEFADNVDEWANQQFRPEIARMEGARPASRRISTQA